MSAPAAPRFVRRVERVSAAGAALTLGLAALALMGWVFDLQVLKSVHPALVSMKANTALGFLLAGAALWLLRTGRPSTRVPGLLLAGGAAAIGGATLFESASGLDFGLDQLLFRDPAGDGSPGRMSTASAIELVLLGLALVLGGPPRGQAAARVGEWLALGAGLLALLSLVAYLYGVRALYALSRDTAMALHTTVAALTCSVSALLARPGGRLVRLLTREDPGGSLARRLLPAAVLVPIALGWVRLRAEQAGLYPNEYGVALFAMAGVASFGILIAWTAGSLSRTDGARQAAQAKVQESEQDLSITLQSIGDAVIATDAEGRVTRMNAVAERLTGWPLAEARTRPIEEVFSIFNEDTRAPAESPTERVLREGIVVGLANHTSLASRDGTERAISDSGAPIRDAKGSLRGAVLVFRDMTQERAYENALRRSQARFDRLYESGIIGIVIGDADGRVTDANDAFLAMSGHARADVTAGKVDWAALTPPETRARNRAAREALQARGIVTPWEQELVRADGGRVPCLVGIAAVDETTHISFLADLTERRRAEDALRGAEAQLRHAQKMEALGTLAGGIAHDFNNLLSVILSYTALLLEQVGAGESGRKELEEISHAARRAAGLTRQLLAFGRRQVLQPKVLDLDAIIQNMGQMLQRVLREDIELAVVKGPGPATVRVDPGQIEQVIMNLVLNATDAMPSGGKLTIATALVDVDERYPLHGLSGPLVRVSVADSGLGMDGSTLARVFEPFFTTKGQGKGTGLGLATVFGIVTQSGGAVTARSELGQGSTFEVYLPRVSQQPEVAEATTPTERPRGTETILLVEDEPTVRRLVATLLRRSGYHVLEAANGEEAAELFERRPVDLVLSDVVMPRMGGTELARTLLASHPGTRILLMSGHAADLAGRDATQHAIPFLQKPIEPPTLLTKVREVLDARA